MQDHRAGSFSFGLVAILLLTGCNAADNSATDPVVFPAFADIETLTEKSCLCKMAGRDAVVMEQRLEKLKAPLQEEGFNSASLPLSSAIACYPQLGERACAGRYYVVGAGRSDFVCTSAQADELDNLWNSTGLDNDRGTTRADAALQKRLSAMRRELAKTIPQSVCK